MDILLVTGSDLGVGKTRVVTALTELFGVGGATVQTLKLIEPEQKAKSDKRGAVGKIKRNSGGKTTPVSLTSTPRLAATTAVIETLPVEQVRAVSFDDLVQRVQTFPSCDWLLLEGTGGIADLIDEARDWADFAVAVGASLTVIVVADRPGGLNQARLAYARAKECALRAGVWLNATEPCDFSVSAANRAGLRVTGVPVVAEQIHLAVLPAQPEIVRAHLTELAHTPLEQTFLRGPLQAAVEAEPPPNVSALPERCRLALEGPTRSGLRRSLRTTRLSDDYLNLADDDFLVLSRDAEVASAVGLAAREYGTSASAPPLVTGWREPHARLIDQLCTWHNFPCGLLWNSGYAAKSAVLGSLPGRGDLVLADRLLHPGMMAGFQRSGARIRRFEHLNCYHLEELLVQVRSSGRTVFVATESVFATEGDSPDLLHLAKLKRQYGFHLIVDEAHAVGWYGPQGAGLVKAAGIEEDVDVLIGTLGKTLASGGAYTLFRDRDVCDFLINDVGEFMYCTALPPANAAAAATALSRVRELAPQQSEWQECSRYFRAWLQAEGWDAPNGDSPIVPVRFSDPYSAQSLASALRETGVFASALRLSAAPESPAQLRFCLKRTFSDQDAVRVLANMAEWRESQ